jgi:Uncharacterized protein conserved in bacteria (DUF2321)
LPSLCYRRPMLSDGCFEFLESLRDAAGALAEAATHYAKPPFRYGEELDALLVACSDLERPKPWNEEAAVRLIRLAGSILTYHDTLPGSADQPARLQRMNALIRIVRSDLGDAEANAVAALVPDLTSDTPKAEGAALRLKPILLRLGKVGYDLAIKIITDVASEVAKKALGL